MIPKSTLHCTENLHRSMLRVDHLDLALPGLNSQQCHGLPVFKPNAREFDDFLSLRTGEKWEKERRALQFLRAKLASPTRWLISSPPASSVVGPSRCWLSSQKCCKLMLYVQAVSLHQILQNNVSASCIRISVFACVEVFFCVEFFPPRFNVLVLNASAICLRLARRARIFRIGMREVNEMSCRAGLSVRAEF